MGEAKSDLPEKQEAKSVAGGDLEATSKDLASDIANKEALHHECLQAAQEFQAGVLTRNEEMKALAAAKKAIQETTGDAATQTYLAQTSLMQVSSNKDRSGRPHDKFQALRFVRSLAEQIGSAALKQLASRMSSALQLTATGDPYGKVKDLLENMILQLEGEADSDVALKAYCDKEQIETRDKMDDAFTEKARVDTHIKQKKARGAKLRRDIAELQRQLAALKTAQGVASRIRESEKKAFMKNKAQMEQGLRGIKVALRVLKEHYGQDAQSNLLTQGASGGIIGMLEVVESDFSKGLTELIVTEETASSYYTSTTVPDSELEAAAKEHEMKLKMKEVASINKGAADLANDAAHASEKFAAIHQYAAMLKSKCSKSDSYEDRKKRRENELSGLREALTTLSGETVFFQVDSTHRLRGARRHIA
jgi:ribosomal protein L29